jgi:hypothetical protein
LENFGFLKPKGITKNCKAGSSQSELEAIQLAQNALPEIKCTKKNFCVVGVEEKEREPA